MCSHVICTGGGKKILQFTHSVDIWGNKGNKKELEENLHVCLRCLSAKWTVHLEKKKRKKKPPPLLSHKQFPLFPENYLPLLLCSK